jgi:SPP1 family predicted phage head-tail adaptor
VRTESYAEKFKVWGEIPREGQTRIADTVSEDTLRLRTWYRTDIEIGDQLVSLSNGATYYVRSVLDADGRRRHLQLVLSLSPGGIA